MSIVNLEKRITQDLDDYYKCWRSNDSLIYVKKDSDDEDKPITDESGPDCLLLTVGSCWYEDAMRLEIDEKKGIKIRPHTSIVIETAEKIALPLNMYGLLFGAGINIYRGIFISSGKIDPGFTGRLKIGFHNGSSKTVVLKRGDKLAYGVFVASESDLRFASPQKSLNPPGISVMGRWERFKRWSVRNGYQIISVLAATISAIAAIIALNK